MREASLSGLALLGVGVVVLIGATLQFDLGLPFIAVISSFQVVATAVLTLFRFRGAAFVMVWLGAIVTVMFLLEPVASSLGVDVLVSVFFGSGALLLWLGLALPVRAVLVGARLPSSEL